MAPRVLLLYYLILVVSQIDGLSGGTVKLGLGFTALSPPEVIAHRNHPLLLNCSGYSEEGPLKISWRFQDAEVREKHFVTYPNGSLYIERLFSQRKRERRWDGNYTCLLRNNVGVLVSPPIHVSIPRMSKNFIHEPQPLTTYVGGQAQFSCQINAVPPPVVLWFKDGEELPQNNTRYTILPSGNLQIAEVTAEDGGNYKCRCSNVAKQKDSMEASLTVLPRTVKFEPPVFFSVEEEVIAVSGKSAVLECFAKGIPNPQYIWKREDGKQISESFIGGSNLHFPQVQTSHAGSYVCVAKVTNIDTGQTAEATHKVYLRVHVPPTFSKVPSSQVIPTSQTVRFDCEVSGVPEPSIHWLKDGEQLFIDGRIKLKTGKMLIVSHTITSDSGIYQCMASNSAGASFVAARLQVNVSGVQPYPPSGLKAVTISSSAILLSWDPVVSVPSSPIQAYTVHYMPSNGGAEQNAVSVNTSIAIERLKPFTNYTFYVRAYNNRSASEPSKPVVQVTGEDVPLVAPKVMLSSLSPTTLHVVWNDLPPEKTRGVINEHRLYFRKHNQASYSVQTVKLGNEFTITGLIPKQKYDVRVLSGTVAGYPSLSDDVWPWIVHEMPEASTSKVPSAPILHLTVINSTALEVEWTMPDDNPFPVSGYSLSFRQQNLPLKHHVTVPANVTKYQLFDLVPQSWYEVHVLAFNENGESQESVRNINTYSGDNPGAETVEVVEPPQQLEAEPTSSTSILLTWSAPITNRNISYYTVRYHPVFSSGLVNESSIYYIRSTNNEVLITDLEPYTLYEFSVRSHDDYNQQGPFSQVVECRTDEDLPSAPEDLTWTPVDAKSIRLSWQPPKYPNGVVTSYLIFLSTRLDNADVSSWNSKEEKGTDTSSLLTGLFSNTHYYLAMKARNGAGLSPATPVVSLNIPVRHNATKFPSQETELSSTVDKEFPYLGVFLGIAIGGLFVIVCVTIICCRNRCCESQADNGSEDRYTLCCGSGYIPHLNGQSSRKAPSAEKRTSHLEGQELDCFTPMLNKYTNGSNEPHLDTKGGYPTTACNGKINGFPKQILVSSQSSLESHAIKNTNTHATGAEENSAATKPRMRYDSKDCKASDASCQDEAGNTTASTVLLEDSALDSSTLHDEASLPEEARLHNATNDSSAEEPKPSSSGAKHNNPNSKSSSAAESSRSAAHPDSQSCGKVPRALLPSSLHQGSQNCSLSSESTHFRDCGGEPQPFSVNAFPSPLPGPRFPQSSSTDVSPEPP